MKEVALLGPTASGKTSLALELAQRSDSIILSLDSLSLYKEIDIASAKPTKNERGDIKHFGIDEIYPNEHFNTKLFFELYKQAKEFAIKNEKNLIIVGGTSFYLKSLIEGLSPKPNIDTKVKNEVESFGLDEGYDLIKRYDEVYAGKISPNDKYRMQKWLEIYFQTGLPATVYFKKYQKEPIAKDITIFEIEIDRVVLKKQIALRTKKMIEQGLIDEVLYLEKKYSREPKAMGAIGIKETLEYLDGFIDIDELQKKITDKTAQLAKRQSTFNKTQFKKVHKADKESLKETILSYLQNS